MPTSAFGILILSALLHAGWNLILKQAKQKYITLWWGLSIGSLCCLPVLIFHIPVANQLWLYALVSAIFEVAYYAALASAYQKEDFSLIYPIARGGAPALLALWAALFLKEETSLAGKVGVAVLIIGLMIVGSSSYWAMRKKINEGMGDQVTPGRQTFWSTGIGLACLVALIISIYSIIDGAAVKHVDVVTYTMIVFLFTAIFSTPLMFKLYGWKAILTEGRSHWFSATAIGLLSILSYLLVLFTYSFAQVSYAGAIREISIVFGALIGWLWLKEDFGITRFIGALVIFGGIVIIMTGG